MTALRPLEGLVVIDEIQRRPDLFPSLRVLADRPDSPATFLILGSASGALMRQSSESLAGRMEWIDVTGFTIGEVGTEHSDILWQRGAFPLSFLSASDSNSFEWRRQFMQTILERDLPLWGVRVPATTMRRFWKLLAHFHGQRWNASQIASAMHVSSPTTSRYLDVMTDAHMIRQLQPYHANLKKRQVKSPKIYVRDSGLYHAVMGISSMNDLVHHPAIGASWEGYVVEQILAKVEHDEAYFWATHAGSEIDLLIQRGSSMIGFECKRADAPTMTRSLKHVLSDLKLDHVYVVYPGDKSYPIADRVSTIPLSAFADEPESWLSSWE